MLETYTSILGTIHSIGWLIGGIVCSGLGVLFILDHIVTVRKSWLLSGVISEVVKGRSSGSSTIYYPVIRFQDRFGTSHNIQSDAGSNRLEGKSPGTNVELYFRSDKPDKIRLKNMSWFYFALVFLIGGFILSHFYLAAFQLPSYSLMIGGISLFFMLSGFLVRPRSGSLHTSDTRKPLTMATKNILPASEQKKLLSQERQGSRRAVLTLMLITVALIGEGIFTGRTQWTIARTYSSTTGHVVNHELDNVQQADNRDYYYYPVVDFALPDGTSVRFQDQAGASTPLYQKDQSVAVLYNPERPSQAQIDLGYQNWLFPFLFLMAGLVAGLLALRLALRNISKPH